MSPPEYENELKKFLVQLNEKTLDTSTKIAIEAVRLIKKLIGESKWHSAKELESIVKNEFKRLYSIIPSQPIVQNIWKRVLKIIQDESLNIDQNKYGNVESIQTNLFQTSASSSTSKVDINDLKPRIFEAIAEIDLDIDSSVQEIANQALDHIHSNEIILTMGKSNTIQAFLEKAAKKRKFHVIIAENEPYLEEHELALNLSNLGLDITIIPYSAIFSCISRVNKVIISTYSIYANGALKANIGTNALALSAKHHNIPLIVCSPLFKLSSDFINSSSLLFNNLNSSDDILSIDFQSNVTVLNPKYDYVSPDLITLFIFNNNSNAPSYVYRLIRELYPSTTDDDI